MNRIAGNEKPFRDERLFCACSGLLKGVPGNCFKQLF
jgi:hypothetical protein